MKSPWNRKKFVLILAMICTASAWSQVSSKDSPTELKQGATLINQAVLDAQSSSHESAPEAPDASPAPVVQDKSCNCELGTAGQNNTVEFEDQKSCDPGRNYLQPIIESFAKADPTKSFVKNRSEAELSEAEVPRKCVTYVMRSFLGATSEKEAVDSFGYCGEKNGIPRQGMMKACVTSDYVNLMYNSFIDVADCLDLPQKLMLPKFLNESGFHINAFGAFRIYDEDNNSMRNILDLRMCNKDGTKSSTFSVDKLTPCSSDERAAFIKKEKDLQEKIKTATDKTALTEELKAHRKTKKTLRDLFDFKTADDSFYSGVTGLASNPETCEKFLLEQFCGNKLKPVGGDTGVGQFTEPAAVQAQQSSAKSFKVIQGSTKPSCQRISKIPGVFNDVRPELANRCDFMRSPPNPVSALIHYGSMLKAQSQNVENYWDAKDADLWSGKNIDDLMNEAKISNYDQKTIKEMLTVLAYNAGPKKPVLLLGNWLQSRIKSLKKWPISKDDFDFKVPLQDEFKKMTADEANRLLTEFKNLRAKKTLTAPEKSRLTQLTSLKLDHLNFSNYIRAYHTGFAKGYLKYVRDAADGLDKTFGKGVCTPKKFLEL